MEFVILGILGLAVGSFLSVLIYRLNTEDKVPKFWQGRSLCPRCKHMLSWKDNIPLLSFVILGGRCRFCKKEISWQYLVVELVTAVAFVAVWWFSPAQLGVLGKLGLLGVTGSMIIIFFSDLKYGLIPDEAVAAGVILGLLSLLSGLGELRVATATGIISAAVFFFVVLATSFKGMGLGDVKLAFLMGFLLGWPKVAVAFWSAFLLGGVVAIFLLVLKKTKLSATIPLGPFLVIGVVISALWSNQLLHLLGL